LTLGEKQSKGCGLRHQQNRYIGVTLTVLALRALKTS